MTFSPEDILAPLDRELDPAIGDEVMDAYHTIYGLAEDDELIDIFKNFANDTTTLAIGKATVPNIAGLPDFVVQAWNKTEEVYRGASTEEDGEPTIGAGNEELTKVPAYAIDFEVGIYDDNIHDFNMAIRLVEPTSGVAISVVRLHDALPKPYKIYNDIDREIGDMSSIQVIELLCSLGDISHHAMDRRVETKSFKRVTEYLGQKFGVSRNEYKITTDLLDADSDQVSALEGAVLYREDETQTESFRSVAIERHRRYSELDADEVLRLKAQYAMNGNVQLDDSDQFITGTFLRLGKTISSPASYSVQNISLEKGMNGKEKHVELTEQMIVFMVATLQEVVASTSENLVLS